MQTVHCFRSCLKFYKAHIHNMYITSGEENETRFVGREPSTATYSALTQVNRGASPGKS